MMMGVDILGLGSRHWPLKLTIKTIPEGWAIGCFADTFGDCRPNLIKLLKTGKYPACRVHLWWSDAHKIAPLTVVKEGAQRFEKIAQSFPEVAFYLSHSCEYNEKSKSEIEARVALLRQYAPHTIPVCSPLNSPSSKKAITEHHGGDVVSKPGEIASLDGTEATDIDAAKWIDQNSKASIAFLWSHRFNLRQMGNNPPPKQRKAAPNEAYFNDIVALASDKGAPPAPDFAGEIIVPITKPRLYKTMAEDKVGNKDPRANKPLLLSPSKAPVMQIVTFKGQVIGKLGYYGPFSGGGYRHYSGGAGGSKLAASDLMNAALEASGSPWVWFYDGTRYYGPVHAAFRAGYFR